MTDAWRRVDEVLQAALLRPPGERDSFLRHACAGDTALENDVRSLLAADEQAGSFLEDPAIHAAARALAQLALSPGSRLGPYEISAQIGAGGMGEVYRALDTNLARQVAIKVLPEAVAADSDRLARFDREAKTLAALNHPNIAAIYGLERSGGTTALVMELVEGLTLAERTAQGAIPVSEALPIARQIAEALEAAHERGIIHRDLKPANIKLRPDGTIKVLDFGLAKQTAMLGADDVIPSPNDSVVGGVVGTPAYMSPEQARGERADKRTDIWAFGCVLFEMLIGRRVFDSTMVADTLALVMTREIDWSVLPTQLPTAVRALLRRCLERDPRKRLRDVAAIRFALEDVAGPSEPATAATSGAGPIRSRVSRAWIVAGVAMLITVALTAALYVVSRPRGAQPLRLSMTLPEGWSLALSSSQGEPTSLVLSPDGRRVAIVARRADGPSTILMRELDSPAARPLAGTEGATSLFWSPDNRFIGFFAEGKVKKVDLSGGVPTVLCDATAPFGGGTWSHEGTIVFSMQDKGNYRLWKVADSGGQPTDALPDGPAGEQTGHEIRPWFLPDGRTLLYRWYGPGTKAAVYAGRLGSPDRVKVVETDASNAQYASGYLLFLRGATLMAQPFDEKRLAVTGDPVPAAEHVQRQGAIPPYRLFSASQSGVLAYQAATEGATLAWLDRQGQTIATVGERANYRGIALSHDETRVAAVIGEPPNLFIINLSNGVRTQLTFDRGTWPAWSHDDRFVDFGSAFRGYRKLANGAGTSERLLPDEKRLWFPFDRGSDDSLLVMMQRDHPGADLTVVPGTGDRTPFRLASTPQDKRIGKFSPDARWVAYVSNELGSVQKVWVAPVVRGGGAGDVKYLISTGAEGGTLPQWSADGRELFYISSSELLTAVQVNGDGQAFQALALPKALFPIRVSQSEGGYNGWHYAVSKDGRFLVIRGSEEPVSIEVNWTAGLKR